MKPTELRIGNLIQVNGKPVTVTGELLYIIFLAKTNYEPIPLTEEWLVKFGFISDNYNVYYITDNGKATGRPNLWVHCFDKDGEIYWDCHVGVEFGELTFISLIKYVHSLQNLYYALTGEELTIKTK